MFSMKRVAYDDRFSSGGCIATAGAAASFVAAGSADAVGDAWLDGANLDPSSEPLKVHAVKAASKSSLCMGGVFACSGRAIDK